MALTNEELQNFQKMLNVVTRQEGYMDVMMHTPDSSVKVQSITCNDVLSYSNLEGITDIKNYTSVSIATLEENLWVLDGSLINPTSGRKYNGYISNSLSNSNGEFETNPKMDITLETSSSIEYMTIILNSAVKSAYPRKINIKCYDTSHTLIKTVDTTICTVTQDTETGETIRQMNTELSIPNIMINIDSDNIKYLEVEFIGTIYGNRRMRIANILFGKVVTLTQDDLISADYDDKCSYVSDSIPSRVFSFTLNNYDKAYNVDNPDNSMITLDSNTIVYMRMGYNIHGYKYDEIIGDYIFDNPDKVVDIMWDDWKTFRFINISTNNDDTATIECGSILDVMTDIYDSELFKPNRYVHDIVEDILKFANLPLDTIIFSNDSQGVYYGDYIVNTVIPALPTREIIQLLAFSVGATLLIMDDGTIKFANFDIDNPGTFTNQHKFTYNDFVSIPSAEQLEYTDDISLPKYNATIADEVSNITSLSVTSINSEVSYSDCTDVSIKKDPEDTTAITISTASLYTHKGYIHISNPNNETAKINVIGRAITIGETQDRDVTKDTLILATRFIKDDPNNRIKNKYRRWYNTKFKYSMQTRGEMLVDACSYIQIQTPFTEQLNGYVLRNHIAFSGVWSGDMEVIAL